MLLRELRSRKLHGVAKKIKKKKKVKKKAKLETWTQDILYSGNAEEESLALHRGLEAVPREGGHLSWSSENSFPGQMEGRAVSGKEPADMKV